MLSLLCPPAVSMSSDFDVRAAGPPSKRDNLQVRRRVAHETAGCWSAVSLHVELVMLARLSLALGRVWAGPHGVAVSPKNSPSPHLSWALQRALRGDPVDERIACPVHQPDD